MNSKKIIVFLGSIVILLLGGITYILAEKSSPGGTGFISQNFLSKLSNTKTVTAPVGTRLSITLNTSVNSGINRAGDVVTGNISSPIQIESDILIPAGSQVTGQVTSVRPAEKFKAGKGGSIGIKFISIESPDGKKYPISTNTYWQSGETGGSRLAKGVTKTVIGAGAGAALGTAIGAIAGGRPGRGAWSGAAIGGGLGATSAIVTKGQEAYISSGAQIPLTLEQPLRVAVQKSTTVDPNI